MVKASGLAAGKGVVVANTRDEACEAVDEILGDKKYGVAGNTIVVEEKLSGEEISVKKIVFFFQSSLNKHLPFDWQKFDCSYWHLLTAIRCK